MTSEIYSLFPQTQARIGFTSIIVSHDIPKVFDLADQIVLLNTGEIDVFASPAEIQHSTKPHIRDLVEKTMVNCD